MRCSRGPASWTWHRRGGCEPSRSLRDPLSVTHDNPGQFAQDYIMQAPRRSALYADALRFRVGR